MRLITINHLTAPIIIHLLFMFHISCAALWFQHMLFLNVLYKSIN